VEDIDGEVRISLITVTLHDLVVTEHVYSSKDNTTDGRQSVYHRATRDRKSNKT